MTYQSCTLKHIESVIYKINYYNSIGNILYGVDSVIDMFTSKNNKIILQIYHTIDALKIMF